MAKRRFDEDEDEEDPFAMIRNMFGYVLDKPLLSCSFGSVIVSAGLYISACFLKHGCQTKPSTARLLWQFQNVTQR